MSSGARLRADFGHRRGLFEVQRQQVDFEQIGLTRQQLGGRVRRDPEKAEVAPQLEQGAAGVQRRFGQRHDDAGPRPGRRGPARPLPPPPARPLRPPTRSPSGCRRCRRDRRSRRRRAWATPGSACDVAQLEPGVRHLARAACRPAVVVADLADRDDGEGRAEQRLDVVGDDVQLAVIAAVEEAAAAALLAAQRVRSPSTAKKMPLPMPPTPAQPASRS